ncbi:hypothetical protein N7462_002860 [Penicillium macrosclerotiorum]|uniref:uncharacterized protein n=1 Tax=Penicillium macrosclerotiorum TaxID=303699 RepID=UPI002548F94A|nr:uncharacterized protein N7462_002860 [Penicillium macrosclerotiorum]KAJ5693437.1 hypothetical protein N7462_002860 [Penicillium macrosclerotiorum]
MTAQLPPEYSTRLPIRTQHCRFCNHLLLATTRDLSKLPRRGGEAQDKAIIVPLEAHEADLDDELEGQEPSTTTATRKSQHVTLLLSTTLPDRRATLVRREDGIEKRFLLRCGRCRAIMGYYLDKAHWGTTRKQSYKDEEPEMEERPPAVYLLPGSVVETEQMGLDGVGEMEWRAWADGA